MKRLAVIWLIIGMNMIVSVNGITCPVPVFRYALEFWEADPYIVEVHYMNSLDRSDQELVEFLLSSASGGDRKSNLDVRLINIEEDTAKASHRYPEGLTHGEYPGMVLKYPRISGINKTIWSGNFTRENVENIINSPARESIAGKLATGTTAVWVLLESGDRRKDRDALNLLNGQLKRLEQTLVLPDPDLWLSRSMHAAGEDFPVISFDVYSISRDDPREEYMVRMLLDTEDDLVKFESEPIVFPVYGRGIALWAIVGKGINQWNISEAAEFLTGPCSCQAKLLNPGVDLLMAMDWDNVVESIADISLSNPLSGMSDFGSRETKVKRLLEEATIERLGTGRKQNESLDTDPARVVYLDIFQNEREETDKETDAGDGTAAPAATVSMAATAETSAGAEPIIQVPSEEKETIAAGTGNISEARGFMALPVLVFAGFIAAVLAVGLVFYWKRVK